MPAKTRAQAREYERRYRTSEKGRKTRSEYDRRRRKEDPEYAARKNAATRKWAAENRSYAAEWKRKNAGLMLLYGARQRAAKSGLGFDLELSDIVVPRKCPWLGIEIRPGGGKKPSSPSLDRVDNAKGYVKGNVEVVSWRANNLKATATLDEMIAMGRRALKLKRGQ